MSCLAEYLRRLREICDRHQVLLIADEIMTGVGRTGSFTAIEPSGVVPDILLLGKGLTGGYAPLSALVTSKRILDPLARGSGGLLHNQTFSHHPVSCAAGVAALGYLKAHKLIERSATMGRHLHDRLYDLKKLPHVGDIRGRGMLAAVEFVADKEKRTPFPRLARMAETFAEIAEELGLVLWPSTGHAGESFGDLVLIGPPFTISEGEINELLRIFQQALEATIETHDKVSKA